MHAHSSTEHTSHTNLPPAHSESLTNDWVPASHFRADKDYLSQLVCGNGAHVFIHSNGLSAYHRQHTNIYWFGYLQLCDIFQLFLSHSQVSNVL